MQKRMTGKYFIITFIFVRRGATIPFWLLQNETHKAKKMLQLSNADFVLFIVFLNNNNYTMFANLTNSYILNTADKA